MKILDHLGQPIDTQSLASPIATPTPHGARVVGSQSSFHGLDPARLFSILRAAEAGDARAYLELAEEMEEKYLHYAAQLATRKRAVCGLEWCVHPASERLKDRKIAEFVERVVPLLRAAAFDQLDALGKGYSVMEPIWDTSGSQWVPREMAWRDPRWFRFDKKSGRVLQLRGDTESFGEGVPLPAGRFIVTTFAAKSGLPIRGGLARAAVYAYLFHNFTLKDWVQFCEKFGKPLILGRYDGMPAPGDLDILYAAITGLGQDAAAMLPRSMDIEFPEVTGARGESGLWQNLLDYLDRQVSKLILGQTLTADTGQGGGGSYALGSVHNEVRMDILHADAESLTDTLNRQFIPVLVGLNFAGVTEFPRLSLRVEEPEDLAALSGIVARAVQLGQPVGQAWFAEKFGIPLPAEGEEILKARMKDEGRRMSQPEPGGLRPDERHGKTGGGEALGGASSFLLPPSSLNEDRLLPQLEGLAAPITAGWLASIEQALAQASSLEEFQDWLLDAWGHLPEEELVTLMSSAFEVAQLRGMDEVEALREAPMNPPTQSETRQGGSRTAPTHQKPPSS